MSDRRRHILALVKNGCGVIDDFLSLAGRRILLTGASSGIGRATAILASRHGATVYLIGRRESTLRETRDLMSGTAHIVREYDLSDLDGIPALVADAAAEFDGLDSVVHAAGTRSTTPLRAVRADSIATELTMNVATAVMLTKGFRDKRIARRSPSVALVSSAMGLVGRSATSVYSASKAAIIGLTRSMAIELAPADIRVNCVCPGVVMTPMAEEIRARVGQQGFSAIEAAHPLGTGQPEDVAKAILFLVSDAARWITGSALVVDGGYTAQ